MIKLRAATQGKQGFCEANIPCPTGVVKQQFNNPVAIGI
jgi:hypothetical protein